MRGSEQGGGAKPAPPPPDCSAANTIVRGTELDTPPCCASQAGVRAIAGEARKKGVGARGLRSIMERLLLDAMFHVSAGLTLCSAFVVVFMALEGRQVVSWEMRGLPHVSWRWQAQGFWARTASAGTAHFWLTAAAAATGQLQCGTDSRLLRHLGALHPSLCLHLHPPNTRGQPANQPASDLKSTARPSPDDQPPPSLCPRRRQSRMWRG